MKYWLSHLPLEVWVDVYRHPWIKRNQLGPIVHRFGNRKFVEYLQFYLHDWGRRTLERLVFNFPEERVCRRKHKHRAGCVRPMIVPQTPVPANIKSFGLIYIGNFDRHTIDLLRQIQPLLVDINLDIQHIGQHVHTPANVRTILANLVPLITGIHSLCCSMLTLPMVEQLFGGEKLAKLKVLTIRHGDGAVLPKPKEQQPATIKSIMEWLTTQQQQPADGGIGARWCYIGLNGYFEQIFAAIHQDFLAAKEPRTFVVSVRHYGITMTMSLLNFIWKMAAEKSCTACGRLSMSSKSRVTEQIAPSNWRNGSRKTKPSVPVTTAKFMCNHQQLAQLMHQRTGQKISGHPHREKLETHLPVSLCLSTFNLDAHFELIY